MNYFVISSRISLKDILLTRRLVYLKNDIMLNGNLLKFIPQTDSERVW